MSAIKNHIKLSKIRNKLKSYSSLLSIAAASVVLIVPSIALAASPTSTLPFTDPNPQNDNQFGYAVSLSEDGTVAVVTAPQETDSSGNVSAGAAYVFVNNAGSWSEAAQLVPTTSMPNYDFGNSANITPDGTEIIVGAFNPQSGEGMGNGQPGAAFIYNVPSGYSTASQGWASLGGNIDSPSAELQESNFQPGDYFGSSVALSSDGSTAVVGAEYYVPSGAGTNAGAAYVFSEPSGGWSGNPTQSTYLTAASPRPYDDFGVSVAVSAGGSTIAVGAQSQGGGNPGFTDIYNMPNGGWSSQATDNTPSAQLLASDLGPYNGESNLFGYTIGLSSNGSDLIVGSPGYSPSDGVFLDGDAYVFANNGSGWVSTELKNPNPGSNDYFGDSVAIADDGSSVLVGAPSQTVNGQEAEGEAYQFTPSNDGLWGSAVQLLPSSNSSNQDYGWSVAVVNNPYEGTDFIGAPGITGSGMDVTSSDIKSTKKVTADDGGTSAGNGVGAVYLVDTSKPLINSTSAPYAGTGQQVTIYGGHLYPTAGQASVNTNVYFGTKQATIDSITETQITVTVPADAGKTIKVTTPNGSVTSPYSVGPSISSFSPVSPGEGNNVSIRGNNLLGATATLNGQTLHPVSNTNSVIVATLPLNAVSGYVYVTTPSGGSNVSPSELLVMAPQINSVSPKSSVGKTIVIGGKGLAGVTQVEFTGGVSVAPATATTGRVTVVVPSGAQTGPVTIFAPSAPGGEVTSTESVTL